VAKQDLLDMKAKQLEEKEKDVKKLQRKLQRQKLWQSPSCYHNFFGWIEMPTPMALQRF